MASLLGIGVATYDIVNTVEAYPPEDAKIRILTQRIARGGNAANTLAVLRRLGHRCSWGGTLAGDEQGRWILSELHRAGIDTEGSRLHPAARAPTSYILQSRATGSRTIAHYRELPEFGYADFLRLQLAPHQWVHFEGRNVDDTVKMLQYMREEHRDVTCSVEIEKARRHVERLFEYAHVLFFSREYVQSVGRSGPERFLEAMHGRFPQARILATWAERGAWGVGRDGELRHSPAHPPAEVVETVGAGDTFNAGAIDALVGGGTLADALDQGCRLAGIKCGRVGFDLPPRSGHKGTR